MWLACGHDYGYAATELVVLKWGDLLTRTFVRLAVVVVLVVFVKAYLPFVIVVGFSDPVLASVRLVLLFFDADAFWVEGKATSGTGN